MKLVNLAAESDKPLAYAQHVHFIDFSQFNGAKSPIYFNTARDPFARFASKFAFGRSLRLYYK